MSAEGVMSSIGAYVDRETIIGVVLVLVWLILVVLAFGVLVQYLPGI